MKISEESFFFSAEQFGPSDCDITDYANLNELVSMFETHFPESTVESRTLDLKYIGSLIETLFSNSKYTQNRMRTNSGLNATQWSNKLKNDRRKDKPKCLALLLGKGTSVYLQSINKLIDYIIWGNGQVLKPNKEDIRSKKAAPYKSQSFAVHFVTDLLIKVLFVEDEFIGEKADTLLEEYLKREYQKFIKNPVFIPGLKANTFISSKRILSDCDYKPENIIKKTPFHI